MHFKSSTKYYHSKLINCIKSIADEKRSVHGKEFLNDIAAQNYSKYNIDVNNNPSKLWHTQLNAYNQSGRMYVVNHRNINDMFATAAAAVADIWFKQPFLKSQFIVHQPFYDQNVKGNSLMIFLFLFFFLDQVIYITKTISFRSSDLHYKNLPALWNRWYINLFIRFSGRFDLPL